MMKLKRHIKNMLLYLLMAGCSSLFVGCSLNDSDESSQGELLVVGDRVPQFSVDVVNADGTTSTFSTERLTGETVIVLFHTTCPDCQRELPKLNQYYLQHKNQQGFQMVAISRAEGQESVAAYWQEQDLQIPYSAQQDRSIYNLFATSIIPRVYFCTSQGIITKIYIEKLDY